VSARPGDRWSTEQDLADACARLSAEIPGWETPLAHGVGFVPSNAKAPGPEHFPLVNTSAHSLPALVMASIVGHTSGTASYRLDRAQLDEAVDLLSPAEAYTGHGHPNLWLWRDDLCRLDVDPTAQVIAVFLGRDHKLSGDSAVAAFRLAPNGRTF